MPHIVETIIITQNAKGEPYAAPFGIRKNKEEIRFAPFYPSKSLENLAQNPLATVNYTSNPMDFVACLVNEREHIRYHKQGEHFRLAGCNGWLLMECSQEKPSDTRPEMLGKVIKQHQQVAKWNGYNRSLGAIIEASIAFTRTHILPPEQVEAIFLNTQTIIEKTADKACEEAFGILHKHYRRKLK